MSSLSAGFLEGFMEKRVELLDEEREREIEIGERIKQMQAVGIEKQRERYDAIDTNMQRLQKQLKNDQVEDAYKTVVSGEMGGSTAKQLKELFGGDFETKLKDGRFDKETREALYNTFSKGVQEWSQVQRPDFEDALSQRLVENKKKINGVGDLLKRGVLGIGDTPVTYTPTPFKGAMNRFNTPDFDTSAVVTARVDKDSGGEGGKLGWKSQKVTGPDGSEFNRIYRVDPETGAQIEGSLTEIRGSSPKEFKKLDAQELMVMSSVVDNKLANIKSMEATETHENFMRLFEPADGMEAEMKEKVRDGSVLSAGDLLVRDLLQQQNNVKKRSFPVAADQIMDSLIEVSNKGWFTATQYGNGWKVPFTNIPIGDVGKDKITTVPERVLMRKPNNAAQWVDLVDVYGYMREGSTIIPRDRVKVQ